MDDEKIIELRINLFYLTGKRSGMEEAAKMLRGKSAELYRMEADTEAKNARSACHLIERLSTDLGPQIEAARKELADAEDQAEKEIVESCEPRS